MGHATSHPHPHPLHLGRPSWIIPTWSWWSRQPVKWTSHPLPPHLWHAVQPDFFLASRSGRAETGCCLSSLQPQLPHPRPPVFLQHSTQRQGVLLDLPSRRRPISHPGSRLTGRSSKPPAHHGCSSQSLPFTDNGFSLPCTDNGGSLPLRHPRPLSSSASLPSSWGGPVWRPRNNCLYVK